MRFAAASQKQIFELKLFGRVENFNLKYHLLAKMSSLIKILAKMRLNLVTHLIIWQLTNEKHLEEYELKKIENNDFQVSLLSGGALICLQ